MRGNILLMEDVKELADLVTLCLSGEGFETRAAEDGFTAVGERDPEFVVLDTNLPGMDGFEFLEKFRKSGNTPVFIVSARDRALFSRLRGFSERNQENIFGFGPFTLDYDSCILKKNGKRVPLSTKEYGCLAWLTEHPGKPMAVEAIYAGVWKDGYGDLTTVAVHIHRLRKKIEEDPAKPAYIETVRGRGYMFNC